MPNYGNYDDDRYDEDERFDQGKQEISRLPASTHALLDQERSQYDSRSIIADAAPTGTKRQQQTMWESSLNEQQDRDRKRYGDHYKTVDLAHIPQGQDAWTKAGQQAAARDKAFSDRMDELSVKAVQAGKVDVFAGKVVHQQMKAEHAQYKADVQGDILSKEIIARAGKETDWTQQLREDRDKFQQIADRQGKRFEAAQDQLARRPQHQERQKAYSALADHARATGRHTEAAFVEKYKVYKAAQFEHRNALAVGNRQEIEAAKAKLDVARTEGIAAKAGLRTSQISQLSRELRAHNQGERLLTKPVNQAQQQNQVQGGFRPFGVTRKAHSEAMQTIRENRAGMAENAQQKGQAKAEGDSQTSGSKSRRQELDERRATLAKAGMTDDRVIRSTAASGAAYRDVISRIEDNRDGIKQIEAQRRQEIEAKKQGQGESQSMR